MTGAGPEPADETPPSQRRLEGSLLPFGLVVGLALGLVLAFLVERVSG